jgi:predicted amidohydrolase YtcJ
LNGGGIRPRAAHADIAPITELTEESKMKFLPYLTSLLLVLLTAACTDNEAAPRPETSAVSADVVLFNGNIVTVDAESPKAQAIAIIGDEILAVGDDEDILSLAGSGTRRVDLGGKTVVPGFSDGHLHSKTGRIRPGMVDVTAVRSLGELVDAIASEVAVSEPGDIIFTSSDWHEAQLEELRLPTRWDLDPVSPDNPVVVIRGGHEYILNSAALEKWNITTETVSPPGGQITFDSERDDITGELVDRARDLVNLPDPPERTLDERLELIKAEHDKFNSLGLTSFRNTGASLQKFKDYQELWRRGELTMRVAALLRWDRKSSADAFRKEIMSWGVVPQMGNEWVRFDSIKLGVDGGYEGGWMTEPYEESFGHRDDYFGLNTVPREHFIEIVTMINELGMRPSTHSVGDAASDLVLDAYAIADRQKSIAGRRWTIEHAFVTRPDQIERIKELDVALSAQSHLYLAGASLVDYWGEERAADVAPVRSWLDAGIPVGGGTDNKLPYVPENPITTFYHWVSRDTVSAGVLGEEHAISRAEALRIATIGVAYLTFEEDIKGSLVPGKLADLVVLSQDIMTVPEDRIMDTKVLATMVGGRFVYGAETLSAAVN